MKSPFALSSVIEKATVVLAFLPLVFMIYPESVAAAYTAQNPRTNALVFKIDSKSTESKIEAQNLNALLAPKVKAYLESKGSPLAVYADEIVKQPQWQRALAISHVESNFGKYCADNNCSGIGGAPNLKSWRKYPTKLDWFKDMSALLEKPMYKERYTNCNTMKGVYVVPGSANWVNGCNKVSAQLMAITAQAEQESLASVANPTVLAILK